MTELVKLNDVTFKKKNDTIVLKEMHCFECEGYAHKAKNCSVCSGKGKFPPINDDGKGKNKPYFV